MPGNENYGWQVVSLYRYPVKSMLGEALTETTITPEGLSGDRAYALIDATNGKVASAKNPRKWPDLFKFSAAYVGEPGTYQAPAPVRITLPDGTMVTNEDDNCNDTLSRAIRHTVSLESVLYTQQNTNIESENFWPDLEDRNFRDTVTEFTLPEGNFFDGAVLHLLTTATLDHLTSLYPSGRFDPRRFRPNIVINTGPEIKGFLENNWVAHTLAIGNEVKLGITRPCPRCVMTTLPQEDLPTDLGILRTVAKYNQANVGVYAKVLQGGLIRQGDHVRIE